jgi:conjugative transfer pilus assembly protein TraH
MKLKRLVAVGLIASTLTTTSNAALDSVLTGMYINASSPDYTTSQFRGTLSGGSIYLRTPISNMQLFSIDPPRFSAGCGGIDMYLGSFSFITSAKLTQFFRSVAQNAAPLLFQMAVAQLFPQLDAAVKKFQQIAQDMNSQQMNSCKMAKGFVNAMEKNPAAAMTDLQTGITNTWSKVKGWAGDFAEAADLAVTQPSDATTRANASFLPDGRKEINELGNITWNALKARTWNGELLNLADNETNAMQMVMSMVGTEVRKSGASASADSVSPPFDPILRLTQLVAPDADSSGTVAIPIWSCGADTTKCENPTKASIASYGIKGFVSLNMLGAHDATAPQIGSIVYNITNCTTSGCGLSTTDS